MSQIEERFAAIETKLDEAQTELGGFPELVASLRAELEANGVTPAALETLARIETKSANLANIVNPPQP